MSQTTQKLFEQVRKYFAGDIYKTFNWFNSFNSHLNNTPSEMLTTGRLKKLEKFINQTMVNRITHGF